MSAQPVEYLAILKASYDYTPQSDEDVAIKENQILYLLEKVDEDWWKVKIKGQSQEEDSPSGLVPAAYVEQADHQSVAVALYEYQASASGELTIKEDERLLVFDQEDEWVLVQAQTPGGKAGWVPGNYIEAASETALSTAPAISASSIVVPPSPPRPVSTYVDPADRVASSKVRSDDIKTWSVSEVDSKGKKKKGTLGIGNGAVFFASESDKTPVQKWQTSSVESVSVEKHKHVHINIGDGTPTTLHFSTGSRDIADEILDKMNASRALSASASPAEPKIESAPAPEPTRFVPPIRSDTPKAVHFSPASPAIIPPREEEYYEDEDEQIRTEAAVALYDFDADGDDELSVKEGEKLVILEKDGDEWWKCRNAKGNEGVVPASYLETSKEDENGGDERDAKAAQEASRRAEEQRRQEQARLEKERQEEERAKKEKEHKRQLELEKAEKERKKAEAEARAKEAAEAAEAERKRRKEQAAKQQSHHKSSSSASSSPSPSNNGAANNGRPPPDQTRVWHDRTGQFRVEAAFLGFNNGKLRLHKVNGVIVEVPKERMSADDLRYVEKLTAKRSHSSGGNRSRVSEDDVPLALTDAANRSSNRSSAVAPKKGPAFDWFDFFLSAGCDLDDCTRYASSFERDKIDEAILPDITESIMRSLGLREGDIIRVTKAIEKRKPKQEPPAASDGPKAPVSPPPNLFAGPGGVLKNNAPRRGRPQPSKSLPGAVDMNAISTVSEQIQRTSSPQVPSADRAASASPAPVQPPARSSSAVPALSGFDDDAWTNRPSSTKPMTPTPAAPLDTATSKSPPAAPPAPPAPVVPTPPPAPASAPPAPTPTTTTVAVPSATPGATSLAKTTEADIFDQLSRLSQLRVANPPTPTITTPPSVVTPPVGYQNGMGMGSSPLPMGQHLQTAAMGGYRPPPPPPQPQQPYNGPRGPLAPIPANQGLLQPLIPTQTGFNSFVPTRPQSQPTGFSSQSINSQPTGFTPQLPSFNPQPTGFNPSPIMSQPTGMFNAGSAPPLQNGASNFNPAFNPGFNPSQNSGLQPTLIQNNPTGFGTGFGQAFANGASLAPQPSSSANSTNPANIFAQMKSGTFASGHDNSSNPQPSAKYDALRSTIPSQATGWAGFQGNYGGF